MSMRSQTTVMFLQGKISTGKHTSCDSAPYLFFVTSFRCLNNKYIAMLARLYKRLVQRTNKRDVEKFLLQQESFRRTLLLLIEGAFAENEPDLSARILDMYYRCPLIFKHYLQLSDPEPDDHDDETEPEELISLNSFRNIRPWSFMTSREVQQRFQIPLRLSKLPTEHSFLKLLRDAYEIDYDRQHILNLGTNPTKWCRKVSFVIRYYQT